MQRHTGLVTRCSGAALAAFVLCVTACSGGGGNNAAPTTTTIAPARTTTTSGPRIGQPRGRDEVPLNRPIITMAGCVLSSAAEGSSTSTLFAWPSSKRSVQILADPTRGVALTYAVVERFFENTREQSLEHGVDVNGRRAWVYVGKYGQGAVQWTLADGSQGYIRARGFDRTGLVAIARALRPRAASARIPGFDFARAAPFGLALVGETAGPIRGTGQSSTCNLANGAQVTVSLIRGDTVSRFATPMDALPLPVLAQRGDAVVAIFSPDAAAARRASRSVRSATKRQWAELLAAG